MKRVLAVGLAVAAVLLGTACDSTRHAATESTQARLQKKPHVEFDPSVSSRDGTMIAVVRHVGRAAYLEVGRAGWPRRTILYWRPGTSSPQFNEITWASPNVIVFDDGGGVLTIDVRTRRVRTIATAQDFNVSSDGRWVTWWRDGGEFVPANPAGVVTITGKRCLLVPTPRGVADTGLYLPRNNTSRVYFMRTFENGTDRFMSLPVSSLRRVPQSCCLSY